MVSQKPTANWKRALLNVVILFHVFGVVAWSMPGSALRTKLIEPYRAYFGAVGLWQSWSMFAPKPLSVNGDVKAEVKFADGSKKIWIAPRLQEMRGFDHLSKERYRKWREKIKWDKYSIIWDDSARWIARSMHTNKANPPVEVKLTKIWKDIPKPTRKAYQPRPPAYAKTNVVQYATVAIRPFDLQ